jgi:hypothetical protein
MASPVNTAQTEQIKKISIPLRMVHAHTTRNHIQKESKECVKTKFKNHINTFLHSFSFFCIKWYLKKILKILFILLLIILIIECIIGIWLWQMPTSDFNTLTSCLDMGTVSSSKERLIYYLACIWGSLI